MPTRKQNAALTLELDFGVNLADLTDPVIVIRNRAQPVTEAVEGTGTLSQADDGEDPPVPVGPILYEWDHLGDPGDPNEPGVYVVEIDAAEGTWPNDSHFFVRVVEHVG